MTGEQSIMEVIMYFLWKIQDNSCRRYLDTASKSSSDIVVTLLWHKWHTCDILSHNTNDKSTLCTISLAAISADDLGCILISFFWCIFVEKVDKAVIVDVLIISSFHNSQVFLSKGLP